MIIQESWWISASFECQTYSHVAQQYMYHKEECEQRTATNADSSVVNCAVLTNAEVSKELNAVYNFRHVYAYVIHGNPYGRWP